MNSWLHHPLTRGLDLNDPRTTVARRRIISEKRFLQQIYLEWYRDIAACIPPGSGPILELGSGPGFMKQHIAQLITSEIFFCPGVDVILDGTRLPIDNQSLGAIVMTDVLHHIPRVRHFLQEASRCVYPGGVMVMIEPWVTPWSRFIYKNFHHEPFEPEVADWEFIVGAPLTCANGALPWIIFERDRQVFEQEFPEWQIRSIQGLMPVRYLVSGGVSLRNFMPAWTFGSWRLLERSLQPFINLLAMFARIVLVKT